MENFKTNHKYKQNYLNLIKLMHGGDNTFTIYTTGIADYDLSDLWNATLCNKIISIIPLSFQFIEIYHYDPTKNITEINEMKQKFKLSGRISKHVFINEPFIYELVNQNMPYIVIDMAHLFAYPKKFGMVKKIDNPESPDLRLNSIYIGYLGGISYNGWFNVRNIIEMYLFKVLPDGHVSTYIDDLIFLGYNFDPIEPQKIYFDILRNTQKRIEQDIRNIVNVVDFEKFIRNKNYDKIMFGMLQKLISDQRINKWERGIPAKPINELTNELQNMIKPFIGSWINEFKTPSTQTGNISLSIK